MSMYKLQYFKVNGRAGGIRILLDYLKVPFTDEYVKMEEWSKIKESTPFGQLPVLKDENCFELSESVAIYRYIGAKHGAIAKTLEERAVGDAVASHVQDFTFKRTMYVKAYMTKAPESICSEYMNDAMKFFLDVLVPNLNKQLEKNGTGFFVGNQPTWVDFFVADVVDMIPRWFKVNIEDLGLVSNHRKLIFTLPGIEERLKERESFNPPIDSYQQK